jgi:hypothetical protein
MKMAAFAPLSVRCAFVWMTALSAGGTLCGQDLTSRSDRGFSVSVAESVRGVEFENEDESEDADGEFFTENLEPYGTWIDVAGYGECWRPIGLAEGWRPYSEGYWAYTDAGWTWVSYEPFGAIVYHYGRWLRLRDGGWVWVPGREWGPAWVSWRFCDEYVGWAPLPPAARWRSETGISTWIDMSAGIGPGHYQFCAVRDFGAPLLSRVLVSSLSGSLFVQISQNVTNITYHNRRPFCGGPQYDWLAARCQRPVPRLRLVCEERADKIRGRRDFNGRRDGMGVGLVSGGEGDFLVMPAPRAVTLNPVLPRGNAPLKSIDASAVDTGWRGVSDRERRQVESAMARDVAGLTPGVAPARKPRLDELKSAPKPVGVVEKREVLTKGGVKPVSEPRPGISREGQGPDLAKGVRDERIGAGGNASPLGVGGRQERSEIGEVMKRDSDAFSQSRRVPTSSGGPQIAAPVPRGPAITPSSSSRTGLTEMRVGEPVRAEERGGMPPKTSSPVTPSAVGVTPTKGALSGIKDQDRRAAELNQQANQFARERSASSQGGQVTRQAGFSASPSDSAKNLGQTEQSRPSQALFERQRLEQMRIANEQASREKAVKLQSSFGNNPFQRAPQTPQPLPPIPAGVRPPQPQGPQPFTGTPRPSVPTVSAPLGGGTKKKEDEIKK